MNFEVSEEEATNDLVNDETTIVTGEEEHADLDELVTTAIPPPMSIDEDKQTQGDEKESADGTLDYITTQQNEDDDHKPSDGTLEQLSTLNEAESSDTTTIAPLADANTDELVATTESPSNVDELTENTTDKAKDESNTDTSDTTVISITNADADDDNDPTMSSTVDDESSGETSVTFESMFEIYWVIFLF